MKKLHQQPSQIMPGPLPLPGWIARVAAEPLDAAAFRSGAALAHLALVVAADMSLPLWRDRLALAAAETCAAMTRWRKGRGALRDALHLTRAGDDPGPAGRILRQWSRAVTRPVSVAGLGRVLEGIAPEQIGLCLDVAGPTPVDRAAAVIEYVLDDLPRAETAALPLADAVLARGWGQDHAVSLLSLAMKPRDLRLRAVTPKLRAGGRAAPLICSCRARR